MEANGTHLLVCYTPTHPLNSVFLSRRLFQRLTRSYTEYEGLFQKNTFARIHINALNVTVPSAKIGYIIPSNERTILFLYKLESRENSLDNLQNGGYSCIRCDK